MTVEEIIKAIPTLTAAEQQRIVEAINASRAIGGARRKGVQVRSDLAEAPIFVLMAITAELKKHGLDHSSVERAASLAGYGEFTTKCEPIVEFVKENAANEGQRRKLMAIMCRLLREDLQRMNLAVTVRLMMQHAHRMQACFGREFPGYIASGFMGLVLGRTEQETDNGNG